MTSGLSCRSWPFALVHVSQGVLPLPKLHVPHDGTKLAHSAKNPLGCFSIIVAFRWSSIRFSCVPQYTHLSSFSDSTPNARSQAAQSSVVGCRSGNTELAKALLTIEMRP